MTTLTAGALSPAPTPDPRDFSIVLGGPLFQLFRKAHLSGDGLELLRGRLLVLVTLSWSPLLVLCAMQGTLLRNVTVPFFYDIEAQARCLLLIPLLVGAELVVHQRLRYVASQFLQRGLIPTQAMDRFVEALASTNRLRNSVLAEVAILVLVYAVGVKTSFLRNETLTQATWYGAPGDGWSLSGAGVWYLYFTLPLSQFLLLRWYYRIFIWGRFLWMISRIKLRLVPTHPDRLGGLGFLGSATAAFAPLAFAHGAIVSAAIATRILLQGGALLDYKVVIIAVAVWILLIFLAPFFVFSMQLAEAKRQGEREYGPLAAQYVQQFDAKWVHAGKETEEPLLGTADIQSLADMSNAYSVVKEMRTAPITKQAVITLLGATLAPIAPLALTMMPLGQALKLLFGILT